MSKTGRPLAAVRIPPWGLWAKNYSMPCLKKRAADLKTIRELFVISYWLIVSKEYNPFLYFSYNRIIKGLLFPATSDYQPATSIQHPASGSITGAAFCPNNMAQL
jgi:hypothetical protein